jgi:hypothetical protein
MSSLLDFHSLPLGTARDRVTLPALSAPTRYRSFTLLNRHKRGTTTATSVARTGVADGAGQPSGRVSLRELALVQPQRRFQGSGHSGNIVDNFACGQGDLNWVRLFWSDGRSLIQICG